MTRKMVFDDRFYPFDKEKLIRMIGRFDELLDINLKDKQGLQKKPKAAIVPHAGYVYSGFNANVAYRAIDKSCKNIIVIGPSHHFAFDDISIGEFDSIETPLGKLGVDKEIVAGFKDELVLSYYQDAHKEHSTETQMPLIKYHFPDANVIEIVYGRVGYEKLIPVIKTALEKDLLIVISTDLSHYHPLKKAKKLDMICLEGIKSKNIAILERGCEACGMRGVKAMVKVAAMHDYYSELLYYNTSYDTTKDDTKVVGYLSAQFY